MNVQWKGIFFCHKWSFSFQKYLTLGHIHIKRSSRNYLINLIFVSLKLRITYFQHSKHLRTCSDLVHKHVCFMKWLKNVLKQIFYSNLFKHSDSPLLLQGTFVKENFCFRFFISFCSTPENRNCWKRFLRTNLNRRIR